MYTCFDEWTIRYVGTVIVNGIGGIRNIIKLSVDELGRGLIICAIGLQTFIDELD